MLLPTAMLTAAELLIAKGADNNTRRAATTRPSLLFPEIIAVVTLTALEGFRCRKYFQEMRVVLDFRKKCRVLHDIS
jgi:hypothetical protein